MTETAKDRYEQVAASVAEITHNAGRTTEDVTIVAVSKTVGLEEVAQAIEGGANNFGENRPDELMKKADAFPDCTWHFIGNIQSRRIKDIVGRASLIHSLYEKKHAEKINAVAAEMGIVQDVLLEVNVSGEESKSGISPDETKELLFFCESLPHLRVRGLMTMAPRNNRQGEIDTFSGLSNLRSELWSLLPVEQAQDFTELSMGMSEDWPVAIEEGATLVRIGRAIFSEDF